MEMDEMQQAHIEIEKLLEETQLRLQVSVEFDCIKEICSFPSLPLRNTITFQPLPQYYSFIVVSLLIIMLSFINL